MRSSSLLSSLSANAYVLCARCARVAASAAEQLHCTAPYLSPCFSSSSSFSLFLCSHKRNNSLRAPQRASEHHHVLAPLKQRGKPDFVNASCVRNRFTW